jgi:Pyridoxal-phosphate dependent enzyme
MTSERGTAVAANTSIGTYGRTEPAPIPFIILHEGVLVVRDDLFPGGTKARFLGTLFNGVDEVVYASPAEGGAQTALATVARRLGKRATIFVARRAKPHPRTIEAAKLGAQTIAVAPGYLSVVQARAREYCNRTGARLMPFGADMPEAINAIAAAACAIGIEPDEVWCASGSGVLARGLAAAWPKARRHAVQVGHVLSSRDVAGAAVHVYPMPFGREARRKPPFPSDPTYDAKAWEVATARKGAGRVVFWNVTGPVTSWP